MSSVTNSLSNLFSKQRIVFWYDGEGEWRKEFESFEAPNVEKLKVAGNEFGTKVRILSEPTKQFLVYVESPRPDDADNWLLDLLLQGGEFYADRASIAIQEANIPFQFRELGTEHTGFFRSQKRVDAIRDLIEVHDDITEIRQKMMAVLVGTQSELDSILLALLDKLSKKPESDPVEDALDTSNLTRHFWRWVKRGFGYEEEGASLSTFVSWLFRGANPFDERFQLNAHAQFFLKSWKDLGSHKESFGLLSQLWADKLHVKNNLPDNVRVLDLGDADVFEVFEQRMLLALSQAFSNGGSLVDIKEAIRARRNTYWYPSYAAAYGAIAAAVELKERLEAVSLKIESIENGLKKYTETWHLIDRAYRQYHYYFKKAGYPDYLREISESVDKLYGNNFLLPLADLWSDKVKLMNKWETTAGIPMQRDFYSRFVDPLVQTKKVKRVAVVVSDAFRYEAAAEFKKRLDAQNRWASELDYCLASLPSFTQLGMASLLPGKTREIRQSGKQDLVWVDDQPTAGTDNRDKILSANLNGKGAALSAETLLDMNSKTEGRVFVKNLRVLYVYHNTIDRIGDKRDSEKKTVEAVDQCFSELEEILKKLVNSDITQIILTADHGFLFQQSDPLQMDDLKLPKASEIVSEDRRYLIGSGFEDSESIKVFASDELHLGGTREYAFPVSLNKFPKSGSGKRYVHGGFSLQEVVIPVLKIKTTEESKTRKVKVDVIQMPPKITTAKLAISLYQTEACSAQVLPEEIAVAVYPMGREIKLSDEKVILCDSKESEQRKRETRVMLSLSSAIDQFESQEVEIRLSTYADKKSKTPDTYASYPIKVQKAMDIDDF